MIKCRNLTVGYGTQIVRQGINFEVSQGDYLFICGENGAGKSTLMKTILGLISPISGELDKEKEVEIGYLPQQSTRQKDFPATVEEIVLSGCLPRCGWRPFYNKEEKQRVKEAMERLSLSSLAKKCFRELSGGQQQRVLLARALCTSAKLLLLDEPTSGLDPDITRELYELLQELNEKDGITIIVISHDIEGIRKYAQKVLSVGPEMFFGCVDDFIKVYDERSTGVCGKCMTN